MTRETPPSPLTTVEAGAWSGFLCAHALISRELDAELRAAAGLALSEFEILLHLALAGGEKRMAHIARDVVLTGGGVTRIVSRLERIGLIRRRSCPIDGRGVFAVLTEKGWARQRAAHRVQVEGLRRLFLEDASKVELSTLNRVFGRIVKRARANGPEAGKASATVRVREAPPKARGPRA